MKNLKNYADCSAEVRYLQKFLASYSASFNNVLLFYSYPLDRQADHYNSDLLANSIPFNSVLYFTPYKIFTQVYLGGKIKWLINNNQLKDLKFICVQ